MSQKDEPSLKSPAEVENGKLSLHMRSVSNVGSLDAPEPNRQRVHEENAVETTHFPNLSDLDQGEPLKGATRSNRDATVTKVPISLNDQDVASVVEQSSSATSEIVQLPTGLVGDRVPQEKVDIHSTGVSVVQRYADAARMKSDGGPSSEIGKEKD